MAFVAVRRIDQTEEIPASRVRSPTLITSMPNLPCWSLGSQRVRLRSTLNGKVDYLTRDHGLQRLNGITMPNNRGRWRWPASSGLTLISSSKRGSWAYAKSCPARGIMSKVLEMLPLNRDWCYYCPLMSSALHRDPSMNREEMHCDVVKI